MPKPLIDLAPAGGKMNRVHRSLGPGHIRINAAAEDEAEIFVFGEIGGFWGGIDAEEFSKEVRALDAKTINVRVNSPGGSVFDGIAIYNALAAHSANIVVHIEGIAASIASVIAMAGDEIRIGESANIMVHKPWSFAIGDAMAMRKEADVLDKLEEGIVAIYAARTGKGDDDIAPLVAAETWYRGQEAVDAGFADVMVPNKKKEKKAGIEMPLLALYEHTPSDLLGAQSERPKVRQFEQTLRDVEQLPNALAKRLAGLAAQFFADDRDDRRPAPRDEDEPAGPVAAAKRIADHIRSLIS